ncbi:uncharacterized protein LOC134721695 [Mytilus trossulus]|uniref:uncharacterized protein LOC134721695 n=1 Tax=Mytilus trossulus TaxID=6551 RepID=UPI003005BECD
MAESIAVNCEPCGYDGLSKSAHLWCNDCGEGFCEECVKDHKRTKLLRSHHLISITDYMNNTELVNDDNCESHKEPFEFFCSQHDSILCLKCFQDHHSNCKISKLSEVTKGSKTSTALADLENEIQSTSQNFDECQEKEDKYTTDLKDQEQSIRDEVIDIRRKINNHLDQLQKTLLRDLGLKYNNCSTNVTEYFSAVKVKNADIKALHIRISNMKKYASEKQVFIGIRQIGNLFNKHKQDIEKNLQRETKFDLELTTNDVEKSLLSDLKSFGDIVVRESSDTFKFVDRSKKQAQLNILKHDSIDRINLHLHQSIEITRLPGQAMSLTPCVILPTKQLAFADEMYNRLVFYNGDGSFSGKIEVGEILDLTPIDSNHIAVLVDGHIKIVDINTKKIERTINECNEAEWGIYYGNGKLYVAGERRIKMIYLDGTGLQYVPVKLDGVYNVAVHNDQIFCVSLNTETIYAIDHAGNQLWTFHDNRLHSQTIFRYCVSTSLDVDKHGNVFIVLPDYDQVLVVSSDGKHHRDILDKSNNLNGPNGISYCRETDQLLVCNISNEVASIYDNII